MNIKKTATIQFGVRVFNKDNEESYKDVLELPLTEEEIMNIVFRFSPNAFMIDEYKAIFRYEAGKIHDMVLVKDDSTYIVTNLNQVFNECYDEFKKMVLLGKLFEITNFDYDAMSDFSDVEDEFGEK